MTDVHTARSTAKDRLAEWRSQLNARRIAGLPPGPGLRIPPKTIQFYLWRQRFLPRMQRRYGSVFGLHVPPTGNLVLLGSHEDVRQLFRGDPNIFRGGAGNTLARPLVGKRSMVTLDGAEHHCERRKLAPPLHGDRILAIAPTVAELTRRQISSWPADRPFPLLASMHRLTFDVIAHLALGLPDGARADALHGAFRRVLGAGIVDGAVWMWPQLGRIPPWRSLIRAMDRIDTILYDEITARRADPDRQLRTDVLSKLVEESSDDELVRDELMTLFVAGTETTAVACAWMFERILRHPAVLARLRRNIDDTDDGYRMAVVKETLRTRTVVPNVARRTSEPTEFAGHRVPRGAYLMPSIGVVHSDPRVWGNDATEFRPERWLEENPPQHAWIPFGGGSHRCLGSAFAQHEMATVLHTVLRSVELVPDRSADERQRAHHLTVVPGRGARVRITRHTVGAAG